jgi:hypothetical protein
MIMKKWILILLLPLCFQAKAQDQDENNQAPQHGFRPEKLFTGGSANIGFGSGSTSLGITPQIGYSFTDWLDAGITFNLNYLSQRDYATRDKVRQTTYGPGAFVRLYTVNFLFATAQFEYNSIQVKSIPNVGPQQKFGLDAKSLLVGAGYAGGRENGGNTYYYLSIMWDVYGDINSPYVDQLRRSTPVIRAGYNIGLFQNRYKKY